ncbi:hypothetical protein [Dyella terrae]|uniref:hypothetical protein n=1 Tax=Dyella terrae TaxID=522259 RepID=UPI001EFE6710|nr:hypothetical protein [Dyella terrae]
MLDNLASTDAAHSMLEASSATLRPSQALTPCIMAWPSTIADGMFGTVVTPCRHYNALAAPMSKPMNADISKLMPAVHDGNLATTSCCASHGAAMAIVNARMLVPPPSRGEPSAWQMSVVDIKGIWYVAIDLCASIAP